MSYPLINGATINGDDGATTAGIDLVVSAPAELGYLLRSGGAEPLGVGAPEVRLAIQPEGLDLATYEPAYLRYNSFLFPPGLDLALTGQANMDVVLQGIGAYPLEFGDHLLRSGVDVALVADGIDLARTDFAYISGGLPEPDVAIQVAGSRAFELGTPALSLGTIALPIDGSEPMELGTHGLRIGLLAASAAPMEVGSPSIVAVLRAVSAQPFEVGTPSISTAIRPMGMDLARAGTVGVAIEGATISVSETWPMEVGEPGTLLVSLLARQSFPLALGSPSVDRGAAC